MSELLTAHFTADEFLCHCRRPACDAAPMRRTFMDKLERLRVAWGRPLRPTSARRCVYWNSHVGGSGQSQHLEGNAADFVFGAAADVQAFAALAETMGFGGIGTGRRLVHVDDRGYRARWTYGDR